MTDPSTPSGLDLRRPSWRWAAIVLAVLALVFGVQRWRSARSRPRPAPRSVVRAAVVRAADPVLLPPRTPEDAAVALSPAESALLAPLAVGATLGPATVTGLDGMRNGALTVRVRVGAVPQTFRIAKGEGSRLLHPVGPYTVYMVGAGSEWSRADMEATWRALDAVIQSHVDLPVPPGMQPGMEPADTTVRVDWRL
jgi:hypothetical protein